MDQSSIEDKRKYLRLNVATKINYRIRNKGEAGAAASEAGIGKNISMDGICFKAKQKLDSGTMIDLEIFLPSEAEPLLLKGEVRWSRDIKAEGKTEYETGVALATVRDTDENRYLRYVNERMMERLSRYLHI